MRWTRIIIIHSGNLLPKFLISSLRNNYLIKKSYWRHFNPPINRDNHLIFQLKIQYKSRIFFNNFIIFNNRRLFKKSTISFFSLTSNSYSSSNPYFSSRSLINISNSRSFLNITNFLRPPLHYNNSINYFYLNCHLRQNICQLRTRSKKNYCIINP